MTQTQQSTTRTPLDTVLEWWQAVQDQDTMTLARVLGDEHICVGGPGDRTIGRRSALEQARAFMTHGSVSSWGLRDVVERMLGDAAVCSYRWEESGRHDDVPFRLCGLATDVLVRTPRGWVISAHHATLVAPAGPAE